MSTSSRRHCQFEAKQFLFSLWRLSDEEYRQLRSRSFSIQAKSLFWLLLELSQRDQPDSLNLPRALLALEAEFGSSSTYLDSWKQSFSFPFLLVISKPTGSFYYLLSIEDYRGDMEFRLARIVDDINYADKNLSVLHQPIAEELSESEITYLVSYLWGFLEGYASSICASQAPIQPFFRHVDSNHVIYGYWDDQFVQDTIEDLETYESTVKALKQRYPKPPISDAVLVSQIQDIVQAITVNQFQ